MTYPAIQARSTAAVVADIEGKMNLLRIAASRSHAQHESVLAHLSAVDAALEAGLRQLKMCEADARYKWLYEVVLPSGGSYRLLYPGSTVELNAGGRNAIGAGLSHDGRNFVVVEHRIDEIREQGVNVLRLLESSPGLAAALAAGPVAVPTPTAAEKAVLNPADDRGDD